MTETYPPPTAAERAKSGAITSAITLGAGFAATVVLGLLLWAVQVVTGSAIPGIGVDAGAVTPPASWRPGASGAAEPMTTSSVLLLLAVLVIAWLVSCRGGVGTPGDAIMTLRARAREGSPPRRWQHLVRTGVPMAILGAGMLGQRAWAGALVALVLWLPALVRSDRRSLFDVIAGVELVSLAPAKTSHGWTTPPHPS